MRRTIKRFLGLNNRSTGSSSVIELNGLNVLVLRKAIRHTYISVLPPDGAVRVTAPKRLGEDAVRTIVLKKLAWITKRREKLAELGRHPPPKYVSGETHRLLGRNLTLEVLFTERLERASLKGDTILLNTTPDSGPKKRESLMMTFYKAELSRVIEELMTEWQEKIGVSAKVWRLRGMKTRWGSCNHREARIVFNLDLAKKPLSCVEYVVVHELLHLIEKKHDENFKKLMTKHLPNWKNNKDELNRVAPAR